MNLNMEDSTRHMTLTLFAELLKCVLSEGISAINIRRRGRKSMWYFMVLHTHNFITSPDLWREKSFYIYIIILNYDFSQQIWLIVLFLSIVYYWTRTLELWHIHLSISPWCVIRVCLYFCKHLISFIQI